MIFITIIVINNKKITWQSQLLPLRLSEPHSIWHLTFFEVAGIDDTIIFERPNR